MSAVKIFEQGNGFSGVKVGAVLADSDGDLVTITDLGHAIHTDNAVGNYVIATVEAGGEMTDDEMANQIVKVRYVEVES